MSKTSSRQPTATSKAVSVGHDDGSTWREHAWLVIALKLYKKCYSNLLLHEGVANACWEDIRPMTSDFIYAWAALFRVAVTSRDKCHGPLLNLKNDRYVLAIIIDLDTQDCNKVHTLKGLLTFYVNN